MANVGLSPNDVVSVQIILSAVPVQPRDFGTLLIAGASQVIDPVERIRVYTSITSVANDFGTTVPEYQAAALAFAQLPQIPQLFIGRWVGHTASSGTLHGAALSAQQKLITGWQAVLNGSLTITVDGQVKTLTAMNFSSAANLNAVAGIVTAALGGSANVVWNAAYSRFDVSSMTTGTGSSLTYATPAGSGTDVSGMLGLTVAAGASPPVTGMAVETPLAAVQALVNQSNAWYGLTFADSGLTDTQHISVASYIEAASPSRMYGVSTSEPAVIDPTQQTDIASLLQSLGFNRTFTQWSSTSPYVAASFFARAFSVDFTGSNTTLTMKFQVEPGVVAESINELQSQAAKAKNANYYVNYSDGVAFIQEGVMASGRFFDTIFNTDWLQNAMQTAVFNVLLTAGTKVPQTDPGVHLLVTAVEQTLVQAVNNGVLAPGVWTGPTFGQIVNGQYLPKGWYVYAPSVDYQTLADRAARKSPLMQVAAKQAGAVHSASLQVNVVN